MASFTQCADKVKCVAGCALFYVSDELRNDREVVLAAIAFHPENFYHASNELRADREIVLAAVVGDPINLEFASNELRADREIVMVAVQQKGFDFQNGMVLRYASDELRDDVEVVFAAIRTNPCAIYWASHRLQNDPEVMRAARPNRWRG